ncbi:MAG: TetR/AcrR family transcriptional regulator [Micrococcaceae bacterium]
MAEERTTARAKLLGAASRLFYTEGFTATGIDTITAEAQVAKKSLYNNFASKQDLVSAYIDERHREWLDLYERRLADTTTPKQAVLAVFDAYIDHGEREAKLGFRGCGLLNAAAELSAGSEGREAVRRHKEQVEQILTGHLQQFVNDEPAATLAEHCSFLLEGAMMRAGLEGQTARLYRARALAEDLVTAGSAAEDSR